MSRSRYVKGMPANDLVSLYASHTCRDHGRVHQAHLNHLLGLAHDARVRGDSADEAHPRQRCEGVTVACDTHVIPNMTLPGKRTLEGMVDDQLRIVDKRRVRAKVKRAQLGQSQL